MKCPRRSELGNTSMFKLPEEDAWRDDPAGFRRCSYCGSMHPDDLFAFIEAGVELGPTDKNYKVYVSPPDARAGQPCVRSSANHQVEGYTQVTAENIDTLPLDEHQRKSNMGWWVKVDPRPAQAHGKFYFQHLDTEQRKRFIELLNAKAIKLGMPGHFYVAPYFTKRV